MSVVFNKDLVILDVEVQDNFDALGLIADNFRRLGFVKASYKDAVIAREKVFATGLPTVNENVGVAIPHTDIEHVHTAAISFTRLKEPVEFTVKMNLLVKGDFYNELQRCFQIQFYRECDQRQHF